MRTRRFFISVLLALGFLTLAGCRHLIGPTAISYLTSLPPLMVERLTLAREVAWAKFHSGAPLHDPAREAALLDDFVTKAAAHGVEPDHARRFFSAQLEASRAVQTELLGAWRAGTAPRPDHPPRDLRADLRPRLDRVTADLAASLPVGAYPPLAKDIANDLRRAGFSPAVIALATAPLR